MGTRTLRRRLLTKGRKAADTGTAKATIAKASRKLKGLIPNAVKYMMWAMANDTTPNAKNLDVRQKRREATRQASPNIENKSPVKILLE
jgi:hypothetical protein